MAFDDSSDARAAERRDEILSVALTAFARSGYHATSMNDIADRMGVAYFTWVSHNRNAFSLIFESSGRVDEEFADIVKQFESGAAHAVAPFIVGATTSDQHLFALGLVGMAEAVARDVIGSGEDFDPVELGTKIGGLAWAGLRVIGE